MIIHRNVKVHLSVSIIPSLYYKIMTVIHIKTKERVKALYTACEQSWSTIEYFQKLIER